MVAARPAAERVVSGCSRDADGTIHVIYDRDRFTEREILLATFRESDMSENRRNESDREPRRYFVPVARAFPKLLT